jgi:hypothetical protein
MSSWWAYNGVTGFLSNEKKFKDAEKRFDNLLVSTSVQDKALSLALNPSFITSLKASSNYQLSSN